jgi:hypothetical protein
MRNTSIVNELSQAKQYPEPNSMPESFAERWARKGRESGFEDLGIEMVACGADTLPAEAAPCVTFGEASNPKPLWEVFGTPASWTPAARERVAAFRMIGADGAGNPFCVEDGTGAVVLLDHEDGFRTRQVVNGSVRQLAECLLAYFGETDPERFRKAAAAIDPTAVAEGSFWYHAAAGLGEM